MPAPTIPQPISALMDPSVPSAAERGHVQSRRRRACRSSAAVRQLESEKALRVAETDVLDESADQIEVPRQEARRPGGAEQVAEDATEVLVTGERQERAAVGDHAHEPAQ